MSSQQELENFIAGMKRPDLQEAREVAIPIPSLDDRAFLVPVGSWILTQEELIAQMAEWRFNARNNFFARFPYSPPSMRRYLEDVSISQPDSLLFMILLMDVFVGHLGIRQASGTSVEIDSVMRGGDATPRGLMRHSMNALLSLVFDQLGIERARLRVLDNNTRARQLYESVGFRMVGSRPLGVRRLPNGALELAPKWAATSLVDEQEVSMSIECSAWSHRSSPAP